jgi:hypothetical protein
MIHLKIKKESIKQRNKKKKKEIRRKPYCRRREHSTAKCE